MGYGANNRWAPPLYYLNTIAEGFERHNLLFNSFGMIGTVNYIWIFFRSLFEGQGWDLYWYNGQEAVGSQVYPVGLSKYYDLFSFNGYFNFLWDYSWVLFCTMISPLYPLDKIIMWFTLDLSDWLTAIFVIDNPLLYWLAALTKWQINNDGSMISGWYIG